MHKLGGFTLALIKPTYLFKGLNIQNAYLRISNLEYLYAEKKIAYLISAYANKATSSEDARLDDYYFGITDMPVGGNVPDILRMIYEDIKLKAQDAEAYPEIAKKFADCADDVDEDLPSPSYAELAAATNILMGGNET